MRGPRVRVDDRVCRYAANANIRVGPDAPWLNRVCRDKLSEISQRMIAFYCGLVVLSLRVDARGFSLVCDTFPEAPPEADIRAAWARLYGGTPRENEIDSPGMIEKLGKRMRDFSSLMGLIKQLFMQWYNRTYGCTGTIWEGRFRSLIRAVGESVRRMLRRFRREMFPRSAHDDPVWKDVIEILARITGRVISRLLGDPIRYRR